MPVPVQIEQQETRAVAHPADSSLVVEAEGGRCVVARTDAQGRLPLLDAALLEWLSSSGNTVTSTQDPALPCGGLPFIEEVTVPSGGWALGLHAAAISVEAGGTLAVLPVGEDGRWWFVSGHGTAQLVLKHEGAPPTRFLLRFDDALSSLAPIQRVPRGGALQLPLGEEKTAVTLADERVASARVEGSWLVVVGRAPGFVDGVIRVGDQPPDPLRIEVGAPLGPQKGELTIPSGGTRRMKVETPPDSAWVADEQAARVELRGRTLILEGGQPGRTHLVVRRGAELFLVPLVIGH